MIFILKLNFIWVNICIPGRYDTCSCRIMRAVMHVSRFICENAYIQIWKIRALIFHAFRVWVPGNPRV